MTTIKTTDVLLETFPRSIPSPLSCEVWRLYHRPGVGYFVLDDIDTSKLSPQELEAFLEPVDLDEPPSGWGDDMDPAIFPTRELAHKWAAHQDACSALLFEMGAMHAPSEGYSTSHRKLDAERDALLSQIVH